MTSMVGLVAGDTSMEQHRGFIRFLVWGIAAVSTLQLFLWLFVVPRFELIFKDMLGGHQLPIFTAGVISARWVIVALAGLGPFGAWWIARHVRSSQIVAIALASILMVAMVQIPLTVIALFMPLMPIVKSLSGGG